MLNYRTDEENHRVCTGGCPESCGETYPCCYEPGYDSDAAYADFLATKGPEEISEDKPTVPDVPRL